MRLKGQFIKNKNIQTFSYIKGQFTPLPVTLFIHLDGFGRNEAALNKFCGSLTGS